MNTDPKSNCCSAPIKNVVTDEGTGHMECTKCGKPCDYYMNLSNPSPSEDMGDLEMIFNTILATAIDAQGLLKAVEQAKTATKQFILSREEKQKQRMKDWIENNYEEAETSLPDNDGKYWHDFIRKDHILALLEE